MDGTGAAPQPDAMANFVREWKNRVESGQSTPVCTLSEARTLLEDLRAAWQGMGFIKRYKMRSFLKRVLDEDA